MQIDYASIVPYAIAVLAVLLVYRRLRRSFGRQRLSPVRLGLRMALLLFLGCALLPATIRSGTSFAADVAGLVAGAALGLWGARRTRYERRDGQLFYVPHTVSGVAVSLLFVGRLVYRLVVLYSLNRDAGSAGIPADGLREFGSPAMFQSPFTVALLCVVIGYYVCYYGLVLWKSTRIGPEDLEVTGTPNAASTTESGASSPGR
jgi:hypothetical protein